MKDGGLQVVFEGFFGEDFDDASGNIESAAVLPAGTGFEPQREFGECVDMFGEGAAVSDFGCWGEPGSVGEYFANERRANGCAVGEFQVLEGGDVFRDGIFDAAAALSDKLHEGGGCDGFSEGGDAEDGAFLHGLLCIDVGASGEGKRFAMGMLFAADPAGHAALLDEQLQGLGVVGLLGEDGCDRQHQAEAGQQTECIVIVFVWHGGEFFEWAIAEVRGGGLPVRLRVLRCVWGRSWVREQLPGMSFPGGAELFR